MKLPRIAAIAVIALLAVGAMGGGFAVAHVKKFFTDVTIKYSANPYYGDQFSARLRSNKNRCEKHRKVKVLQKQPGKDDLFGTDRTNRHGKYVVAPGGSASPGDYYAKAKKKKLKHNRHHKHVCKKGRSDAISVP
jgi:hypothetical protein